MSDLEILVMTIEVIGVKGNQVHLRVTNETHPELEPDLLWLRVGDELSCHFNPETEIGPDFWDRI